MGLIQEVVDFHAANVNPRTLVVGTGFFGMLTSQEELRSRPLLRHYLLLTQYTVENSISSHSGPSLAKFLDKETLGPLLKKPEVLSALEASLQTAREKYLPLLEPLSNLCGARGGPGRLC